MKTIHWAEPDITEEEIQAVKEAVESTWIGGNGPLVKRFEKEWAREFDTKYAIAVNNGTSALLCALQAFREKMGQLTIGVPTFTYLVTVNAASEIGQKVKLIDCSKETWNIQSYVPKCLDLLMPVDVGGLPVDYDSLKKLSVPILADSAEAVGAKYKGKRLGSQGKVHIFSLHAAKVITTGEGGIITTNDKELYEIMTSIANQGYPKNKEFYEYAYARRGFNYRMPELQAALGLAQLKKLEKYVRERREKAKIYKDVIGDLVEYQKIPSNCFHSYFLFGILVPSQLQIPLCKYLYRKGITAKVTWRPAHKVKFYETLDTGELRNSEWVWHRILSLPIHNVLNEEDTNTIAETVKKGLQKFK